MKFFISYTLSFSVIVFMVFVASCAKDKAEEPVETLDTVGCIQPGEIITYVDDIEKIMETYCTDTTFGACHQSESAGGSPGLDYTNYDGIAEQAEDGSLIERVFNSPDDPMPDLLTKGPQTLSDCDKVKLQRWVEQDYPEQ